ncbi:hypothetical protein AC579_4238 [Pseudocercospora musae]|uniref:Cwf19-like C-terminal domain-containing protein n=1 Tax=Pseudocercospora musae TaxID=113226 RepID=A0A139IFH8_9PEZI|nr:hypothetical protein AC579_4238 [Pseudocercospora musae]
MASKMHASPLPMQLQHKLTPYSVVIGSVNGRLAEVFEKVGALNQKHHFAICIIAGNLFADPDNASDAENEQVAKLIKGDIEVLVPTYFALGDRALPPAVVEKVTNDGGELCPNLSVLGRKVSIKTADGMKLVAIGGKYSQAEDESMDEYAPVYTDRDIESAKDFKDADILITSEWPAGVVHGSRSKYDGQVPTGVHNLGELVSALKPRYHFSTSAAFFEREPFFHNVPAPRPITRFLSFAPYGNPAKQKALYAFSLEASAPPPDQLPAGTTASPFTLTQKKRKLDSQEESFNSFRFSNGDTYQPHNGHDRRIKRHRRRDPVRKDPMACYFCISNNEDEAHMVADIGTEVYLTVAKGPLTTPQTFPGLDMPCHMLIIPLQHAPTIRALDSENREATHTEMKRYRTALHNMCSAKSTRGESGEAQLGAVTWEISRGGGVHLHWQFLPVPVDMVKKRLVEAAFVTEAENRKYPKFLKEGDAGLEEAREGHYFRAMIWSEGYETEILLPLTEEFNFDLQFARRVLGKLLGLESRSHWKDVVQTKDDEMKDKDKFEEAFAEFKYE